MAGLEMKTNRDWLFLTHEKAVWFWSTGLIAGMANPIAAGERAPAGSR